MDTRSEDYTYKDDITVLMIIYIAKLFICQELYFNIKIQILPI